MTRLLKRKLSVLEMKLRNKDAESCRNIVSLRTCLLSDFNYEYERNKDSSISKLTLLFIKTCDFLITRFDITSSVVYEQVW